MSLNGRYLLDTNIVIALFAKDAAVHEHLMRAEQVYLSAIVLGELFYGVERSAHVEENRTRVETFASGVTALACDAQTARTYGEIKDRLRAKGRPIPENDIWIAATAARVGALVLTADAHFEKIRRVGSVIIDDAA